MKKSRIVLITISAVLVLIVAYGIIKYLSPCCAEDPCKPYKNLSYEAANTSNINLCLSIDKKNGCQFVCMMEVAYLVRNSTICADLQNQTYKDACLRQVNFTNSAYK